MPGRSELAKALRYMLARWPALMRAFDDGRLALDNNAAERALRSVAVGRKNYLFGWDWDCPGLVVLAHFAWIRRPEPCDASEDRDLPVRSIGA